jgi:hypothetical protein
MTKKPTADEIRQMIEAHRGTHAQDRRGATETCEKCRELQQLLRSVEPKK